MNSDSTIIQDTGLTIISKNGTSLNITTCYENITFTIPIPKGITAINLMNINQTKCDNGTLRYTYTPPSPAMTGHIINPPIPTATTTNWAKISERQRTRYDKAVRQHLFNNSIDHHYIQHFDITPGDILFEQEQTKLPPNTFDGIGNFTLDTILPDSWNPLDWIGIDLFGWIDGIFKLADSIFYIFIALTSAAAAIAVLVCVWRCESVCHRQIPQARNAFQLDIRTTTEDSTEQPSRSELPPIHRRIAEVRKALIKEGDSYRAQQPPTQN